MTLTPERRQEIEAMLEQITPGEWFYETNDGSVQSRTIEGDGWVNEDIVYYIANADQDGPFLAATPVIIRELLAEIDRLQEERWMVPCLPCMGYSKTSYRDEDYLENEVSHPHE